jgi:hypothetical protein
MIADFLRFVNLKFHFRRKNFLRRIHKRHRDPQRAFPAAECALCGGAVYRGEICWRMWGRVLCGACAGTWMANEAALWRMSAGEVAR